MCSPPGVIITHSQLIWGLLITIDNIYFEENTSKNETVRFVFVLENIKVCDKNIRNKDFMSNQCKKLTDTLALFCLVSKSHPSLTSAQPYLNNSWI